MKKLFSLVLVVALAFTLFTGCGDKGPKIETITLEDGNTFVGIVVDGVPNGEGTLTDIMGSEWKGNFVNGKLEGYGYYLGYDLLEYEGFFVNGLFEGYGHWVGANGDDFKGMFVGGSMNGVGRMEFTTGCFYEGGWVNGHMHGMGWMTWPVGDVYFGEWKEGNPVGWGCKMFYDSAFGEKGNYATYNKYVGEMVNNLMHGWGIMYFAGSGGVYVGGWEEGVRNDEHAVYYFEPGIDCVKFEGAFSRSKNNGWIWGEGTMWYSDGRVVTGVWEGLECIEEYSSDVTDPEDVENEAEAVRDSFMDNELVKGALEVVA